MKNWLTVVILAIASVLAYGTSVQYGFSQDDFFHLTIARVTNLGDILQFFIPRPQDWIFYRPVSTQVWYSIFASIFGWMHAAVPMHVAALVLHIANAYLVYSLLRTYFKQDERRATVGATLYAVSGVHFLSLFYIGATQQLLMTFFGLIAIRAMEHNKYVAAGIAFILSLLSKELAVRLIPVVFILYLMKGDTLKVAFKKTAFFAGVGILYVLFRLSYGLSGASEYMISFNPLTTFATIMWYAVMSLGAPENILQYGLSGGRIDFVSFTTDHGMLGVINVSALLVSAVVIVLRLIKNRNIYPVLLWGAGILPVLLLPTHRYAHYLDISLIGIVYLLVADKKIGWMQKMGCVSLILASFTSIAIDRQTHWTVGRANQAQEYITRLDTEKVCNHDTIVFAGDQKAVTELSYSLMYANGPRVICNDEGIDVVYTTPADLADRERGHTISEDRAIIEVEPVAK